MGIGKDPPLPPLWALGFHQSRWGYDSEAAYRDLAEQFRTRKLPCDVLYFDIDYMDGFRTFTWDRQRFPLLPGLLGDLGAGQSPGSSHPCRSHSRTVVASRAEP